MDIIDIMLAKALTPQGQVETYAAKARKAAQDAAAAEASAEAAAQSLEDAAEAKEAAEAALADVQEALEALDIEANLDLDAVDTEVNKMTFSATGVATQNNYTQTLTATMPDGTTTKNVTGLAKLYKATGSNEDGGMTQKAITDALAQKANTSDLASKADASTAATKTYVDEQIAAIEIPSGNGGVSNLGSENSGKIVVIGSDGNIVSGTITEEALIEALIIGGNYIARDAVGLEIDFSSKTFTRTQQAANKTMGSDFDSYLMYGGRKRCIVDDSGAIVKFYGETGYTEENSNYQVMVYQPKFYYQRMPLRIVDNKVGKVVEKDSIMISYTPQNGFKIHPLFVDSNGDELDYVLLGAYEAGLYSAASQDTYQYSVDSINTSADKLVSKANVKPLTGTSGLNMQSAEQLANNRGAGWHIYTIEAESANQMLELVEFGTLNGQSALGKGVSNIATNGSYNQAALTGSTSSLGNASGSAASTTIETNNSTTTETENGKVSISYRGLENPWGNTWTMLGGIIIYGNTTSNGGVPYICSNYNYAYNALSNNYESAQFSLPNTTGWISAFGYGEKKYDWLLMPATVGGSANSALPVGDNGWFDSNLTGIRAVLHGGSWSFEDANGPFYYACDKQPNDTTYKSYGARLMFVPTKNSVYTANIAKWQTEMNMGG